MSLGVVGSRGGFRVVLDGKNRVFPVLDPLHGTVIEVQMGDFERFGARNAACFAPDSESVVL